LFSNCILNYYKNLKLIIVIIIINNVIHLTDNAFKLDHKLHMTIMMMMMTKRDNS